MRAAHAAVVTRTVDARLVKYGMCLTIKSKALIAGIATA
jgi:hypothetical protein